MTVDLAPSTLCHHGLVPLLPLMFTADFVNDAGRWQCVTIECTELQPWHESLRPLHGRAMASAFEYRDRLPILSKIDIAFGNFASRNFGNKRHLQQRVSVAAGQRLAQDFLRLWQASQARVKELSPTYKYVVKKPTLSSSEQKGRADHLTTVTTRAGMALFAFVV